jgi:hypothetical protein
VSSCLLSLAGDAAWPPTLRDMAAGHLQHLLESHSNLEALGVEHRRRRSEAALERLGWRRAGPGAGGGGRAGRAGGGGKFTTARERADKAKVAAALASVAAGLAGSGGAPAAAAAAAAAAPPEAAEPSDEERRAAALDEAAGSHPGLAPFMETMTCLVETGHELLELRGARGVARTCFVAARGAAAPMALLHEAKAAAAAAGAVGALLEMLRCAQPGALHSLVARPRGRVGLDEPGATANGACRSLYIPPNAH